jgi:hypothetical protein
MQKAGRQAALHKQDGVDDDGEGETFGSLKKNSHRNEFSSLGVAKNKICICRSPAPCGATLEYKIFLSLESRPQGAGATCKWKVYFLTGP